MTGPTGVREQPVAKACSVRRMTYLPFGRGADVQYRV